MKYAIFGAAGAVGSELGKVLYSEQTHFRVVGRSIDDLKKAFKQYDPYVEYCAADLTRPEDALRAASGVETIFYTVGVPYWKFELHPILSETCVAMAAKAGVKQFVHLSTLYSFGLMQGSSITESHPRNPHTFKGQMRKKQEDIVYRLMERTG